MTRPLRIEFPGALYHVTSRGNRRNPIYQSDEDRRAWLDILGHVCARHNFLIHSFCQMGNHYHLLVETVEGNLGQGMRQLNGVYSQYYNWRHSAVGHLFQGRYKAILVQKESYLLEVARYIVLNPLRAKIIRSLDEWPWSSHHLFVSDKEPPNWLERDWLLRRFANEPAAAVLAYQTFVLAGVNESSPLSAIRHQILLGDDAFVAEYQCLQQSAQCPEVVRTERRAVALSLAEYRSRYADRNEAMARAYLSTAFTMPQIANAFEVSVKTVSRAVAAFEKTNVVD
jgi:putative transposase